MKLKNQKGISGVDIVISIMAITILVSVMANIITNINLNTVRVERKSQAIAYAVQEIEKAKGKGLSEYIGQGIEETSILEDKDIFDKQNKFSGYHKKISIEDYIYLIKDTNKKSDIVKKVTVEISYKFNTKTEKVSLYAYIK